MASAAGGGGPPPDGKKVKSIQALIKKGRSQAKGSWISRKDPDEAEKTLKEAKKQARALTAKTHSTTIALQLEILELLAAVQYDMNLPFDSAKTLEEASRICFKADGDASERGIKYLRESAMYSRLNKQYEVSAKKMVKAARHQGEEAKQSEAAIEIFLEAIDMLESEERWKTGHDTFNAALRYCVSISEWKVSLEVLQRQCAIYEKFMETYRNKYFGGICGQMIIYLILKDVKTAQSILNESVAKHSEWADRNPVKELAERFIRAFELADAEQLEAILKSGDCGIYLPNCIANIARTKLNMVDITPLDPGLVSHTRDDVDEMKSEMTKDVTDDVLKSSAVDAEFDETGAPML